MNNIVMKLRQTVMLSLLGLLTVLAVQMADVAYADSVTAGSTKETAATLKAGDSGEVVIENGESKWFTFTPEQDGDYCFLCTYDEGSPFLSIYTEDLSDCIEDGGDRGSGTFRPLKVSLTKDTVYYIKAEQYLKSTGSFSVHVGVDTGLSATAVKKEQYVDEGEPVTLEVKASCNKVPGAALTYEWQVLEEDDDDIKWVSIPSATDYKYTFAATEDKQYRAVVSDEYASRCWVEFDVYVNGELRLQLQEEDNPKLKAGDSVTFAVEPSTSDKTTPITYQWYKAVWKVTDDRDHIWVENEIKGATSKTVTVTAEYGSQVMYFCRAKQGASEAESDVFVTSISSNLKIEYDRYKSAQKGNKVILKVDAVTECGPLTYRWFTEERYDERTYISGALSDTLEVTAEGIKKYYCEVRDACDSSEVAKFRVVGEDYKTDSAQVIKTGEFKIADIVEARPAYFKFVPEVSGEYRFYSSDNSEMPRGDYIYTELLNDEKTMITYDDGSLKNNNFEIKESLKAGRTYYLVTTVYPDDYPITCKYKVHAELVSEDKDAAAVYKAEKTLTSLKDAEKITLEDEAAVTAARKAYDALTPAQQKNVDKAALAKLTAAEKKIAELKKASTDGKQNKDNDNTSAKPEAQNGKAEPAKETGNVAKGNVYTVSKMKYKVTNADLNGKGTVTLIGTAVKKNKLTKLTVPAAVTIEGVSFKVTAVANKAFRKYTRLKTVSVGKNVAVIGNSAFAGDTALTKVTIGKGVTKIGKAAFQGCKKLGNITIKSAKLKSVGKNAVKGIHKKAVIKVPGKQMKKYKKLFSSKTGFKKSMKIRK